jgi:hypothetical protein
MKVLLIDPPHKLFPGLRMWTPSFGLLQLGAYLEREGIEVQIVDATALSNPWKVLATSLSESKAEVIGITCSATCLSPEAIQTIHLCRKLLPNSIIVAGGSHFTLMAEPILWELKELDYILLGEGEVAFSQFLKDLTRGGNGREVKSIAYREDGKVILNERQPPIPNLNTLPLPAYHLIEWGKEPLVSPPAVAVEIDALIVLRRDSGRESGGDGVVKKSWRRFLIYTVNMVRLSLSLMRIRLTGAGNVWRSFLKNWGGQVCVSISGFNHESKTFFETKISFPR